MMNAAEVAARRALVPRANALMASEGLTGPQAWARVLGVGPRMAAPRTYAELRQAVLMGEDVGPPSVRTVNPTSGPSSVGGAVGARIPPAQPPARPSQWVWRDGQWVISPGSFEAARQQALGIPLKASEVAAQKLTASERESRYRQLKADTLRSLAPRTPIKASETTDAGLGDRRDRAAQQLIKAVFSESGRTVPYRDALMAVLRAEAGL